MPRPIGVGELVADQLVDGLGIGNTQERLGEAHQRDAFAARQREFIEERVDAAFAVTLAPRFENEAARGLGDPRRGGFTAIGSGENVRDSFGFVATIGLAYGLA